MSGDVLRAEIVRYLRDQCEECHMLVPYGTFPATHRGFGGIPCHGNKAVEPYIRHGGIRLNHDGPLFDPRDILAWLAR
jgi:hypothetical protein